METAKKTTKKRGPASKKPAVPANDLNRLQRLLDKPVRLEKVIQDETFEFLVHPVRARVAQQINALGADRLPPTREDKGQQVVDTESPDYPKYLEWQRRVNREQRALFVFHGVPMIREAHAGLETSLPELVDAVEAMLPEDLLNELYAVASGGTAASVTEFVNFSTGGSPRY